MQIVLCLDYSSFTEKILSEAKKLTEDLKAVDLTVIHVIDQALFYATTGFEVQLGEQLDEESKALHKLCVENFGPGVKYLEEYGIPRLKIDEMLEDMQYDMLIVGSHSRHGLGERLVGGVAEHLLRTGRKPILIIP